MTKLSVIIIAFNSESFIQKCVSSVVKNLPKDSEVIVLDNASEDKTLSILKSFKDKIKLIESSENLGFGKGNNQAVKVSKGEYLFLLNPDTEIKTPIWNELIEFYESIPEIGIVAPQLIMLDGRIQPSVKKLPTVLGAFNEYILKRRYAYSEYIPEGSDPQEVEAVYGAALLIKKDLYKKLGGFDEKYFMYYEDIDFCRRLRLIGKKIYYFPKVQITHIVGGTKSRLDKYQLNYSSATKYHGFLKSLTLQLIFKLHRFF